MAKEPRFELSSAKLLEMWSRSLDGARQDLEELRSALKIIEKHARAKEREVEMYEKVLRDAQGGKLVAGVKAEPAPDAFASKSIANASFDAIEFLGRPLHARELVDILEAGGKRIRASRPAVSIASALSRDARFIRVGRNTFDIRKKEESTE